MSKPSYIPLVIICGMLLLALSTMPYAYYTFLRISVCIYSAYLAYKCFSQKGNVSIPGIIALAIAILYNPIIKITMQRDSWFVANIITMIALLITFLSLRRKKSEA